MGEIIVALGMLPHEQIIGKLIPIVEGRVQHMAQVPRMTRLLALWSLATSGMIKPQTVEPIFYSIFANPAEATEMRIAAFNVLLKLNPAMDVFQKIAARTWYEQDKEVLKVVNTALWTLSQKLDRPTRCLPSHDPRQEGPFDLPLDQEDQGDPPHFFLFLHFPKVRKARNWTRRHDQLDCL